MRKLNIYQDKDTIFISHLKLKRTNRQMNITYSINLPCSLFTSHQTPGKQGCETLKGEMYQKSDWCRKFNIWELNIITYRCVIGKIVSVRELSKFIQDLLEIFPTESFFYNKLALLTECKIACVKNFLHNQTYNPHFTFSSRALNLKFDSSLRCLEFVFSNIGNI